MKYLITFVFTTLTLITISCGVKLKELSHGVNHYDINLKVSPEDHRLSVAGSVVYISPEPLCDSAIFYLHKQFKIKSVSGPDIESYKFYESADTSLITNPNARILHVRFKRQLNKGETTVINFEYSGEITDIPAWSQNIISKTWTEIGSNLPWFPYNNRHGEFTFNLTVECTEEYQIRSAGSFSTQNNVYKFQSLDPLNDIPVVASKNINDKTIFAKDYELNLYYTDIHDSTAEKINEDLKWILENLAARFGKSEKKNFTVIQAMRDIGGSYSHLGVLSLSQLYDSTFVENREKYFMYLSHGAARLWWWQAPHDWNDWMNEGFAEFSALLLMKEKFGDNIFSQLIKEKEDSLSGTPPLWLFNREHLFNGELYDIADKNLNSKAPIILYKLYNRIGKDNFYDLCREMTANDISSTKIFLKLLEQREGKVTAEWFEEMLKSF